jgi:hypothetical protein
VAINFHEVYFVPIRESVLERQEEFFGATFALNIFGIACLGQLAQISLSGEDGYLARGATRCLLS